MKEYTIRIEVKIEAMNDDEAKKKANLFNRELPRMEGLTVKNKSLYSLSEKKVIQE